MKGQQGMLFDAEEMNSIEKGNLWNQQQGLVKGFTMDDERLKNPDGNYDRGCPLSYCQT